MRYLPFVSVFLGVFLDNLLFNVLIPVLPFYAETLHLSHTQVGWLVSSYTLALLCTVFIAGMLTDRFGATRTFFMGSALLVIAVFLLRISDSYALMLVARALQGLSAGCTWVAGFAYVAKASAPPKAARNLIVLQTGMGIAEFTGPVIGGFLYQQGGAALLFQVLLSFAALNFVLRVFVTGDAATDAPGTSRIDFSPLKDRRILQMAVIYLCGGFLLSAGDPILPVFLKHQFSYREGLASVAFFVITLSYYALALPITARTQSPRLIYLGVLISAPAFALIFTDQKNPWFLFSALSLFGFGTGLFIIPIVARIAEAVAERESESYGVAFSSGQWTYTLGMFLGPLASTQLVENLPYAKAAMIIAAVPLTLLVLIRRI